MAPAAAAPNNSFLNIAVLSKIGSSDPFPDRPA
jgi:hypothetical protein